MPVAASATRWAPARTRSTRVVVNVLSPVCSLAPDPFRFDDNTRVGAGITPAPVPLKRTLGNGRDLARVLLRLPRRTFTGFVRGVFVGHELTRLCARRRGGRGGGRRRAGRAGRQRSGD